MNENTTTLDENAVEQEASPITEIQEELSQLSLLRGALTSLNRDKEGIIQQLLANCPDLQETYNNLNQNILHITERICDVEKEVKTEVVALGESVKGDSLHAVFSNGKTSWDTKGLDGFAVANPKILKFKKTGNPSVSIRDIK